MRQKMKRQLGLCIYFLIWGLLVLFFWFRQDTDGFGYGLLAFYLVLPLSAFLVSVGYGMRRGGARWLLIFFFGGMEVLTGAITFDLANTVTTGHWNMPAWEMAWYSMVPALLGMVLGAGIQWLRKYRKRGGGR